METLDRVNREGRERLYPSLTNPSWLVLRRRRGIFEKWLSRIEGNALLVLDVGGRIQPYRALLENRLHSYVALDLRQTPLVNVVARGEQIPLPADQFDLVLCTQVLEYVPEPAAVIAEIHRVLKPGGYLLLSVPSASPGDADGDSWRFLPAGLRHLLAGFRQFEIVPEGSSVAGLFRNLNACLSIFVRYPALRSVLHWTVCPVVNLCGEMLERVAHSQNSQFAANYSACARK